MRRTPLLIAFLAFSLPSSSDARQTIVDEWRPENGACTPADGTVVIGPKSLTMDSYSCTFETVSRAGDTVTWQGVCGGPDERPRRSTVVARLVGKRMVIEENGRPHEVPYLRCSGDGPAARSDKPATSSDDAPAVSFASYVGRYTSSCLPGMTCLATIEAISGDRYLFRWSARDQGSGRTYCDNRATMTIGTGRHEDEKIENVLQGRLDGTGPDLMIAPVGDGKIWLYVNGSGCDVAKTVRGQPSMNGIYDLQL